MSSWWHCVWSWGCHCAAIPHSFQCKINTWGGIIIHYVQIILHNIHGTGPNEKNTKNRLYSWIDSLYANIDVSSFLLLMEAMLLSEYENVC